MQQLSQVAYIDHYPFFQEWLINTAKTVSSRLRRSQDHFINGKRVKASKHRDVVDPATEKVITRVGLGGKREINLAVQAARKAFPKWSVSAPDERTRIILKYADLIEENQDVFTELAIRDGGIPRAVAETCAFFCALFLRYYAGWPTKITGQTLPSTPHGKDLADVLAYTLREPIGVVGGITPWNYAFGMEMLKIAPALATGCCLVLKPAEEAPIAGLFLAELAHQAGVPDGVFSVVNGLGHQAGAALAEHPDVDKIAFTGSTEVGRLIVHAATGNLKKVSLELGGKSPVFVFPDADMDLAIPGAAMAGFAMSGQNCVCGSRLYVHEDVADQVAEGIAAFAAQLSMGSTQNANSDIGPLISAKQRNRVEKMIRNAKKQGAKLVCGGARGKGKGFYIQPTLFDHCKPSMELVKNEVFGPVIAMQRFSDKHDFEALAAMANDSCYGLSGSVWTRDLQTAMVMTKAINTGQIGVNCHAAMDPSMPFGGTKESGWGAEFGEAGIELFTKDKAVTLMWN